MAAKSAIVLAFSASDCSESTSAGKTVRIHKNVNADDLKAVYNNKYVIDLDELPEFKGGK